jgi:hypothetical protein
MCTRDESFTIFDVGDCYARGYERTGFFEVDTQNRSDWMLQLTDREGGPPGADDDVPPDQVVDAGGADDEPLDQIDGGGDVDGGDAVDGQDQETQ